MLVMLTINAPNNAAQNPETTNWSSNAATSANIAAFTTKTNKPRVTRVMGNVSKYAIGGSQTIEDHIEENDQ